MTKKRVLYIHHGKGIGGAAISLLQMVKALDREQFEPMVLFLHYSAAWDLFEQENIPPLGPVNLYDFPHTTIWSFSWYHTPILFKTTRDTLKTLSWAAKEWYTKLKPDLVHLNTSSLIAWGKVARTMNIPVVWHIREPLAPGYWGIRRKIIQKTIARYATKIVPICKQDSLPWHHNTKVSVLYNAVNTQQFNCLVSPASFYQHHHLDPTKQYLLFLGGLSREKGTLETLTIFQRLREKMPDVHLLLAGSWPKKRYPFIGMLSPGGRFRRHVARIFEKVKESVHLLGPITNVAHAMAAADIILFPATKTHFARPVIEAGFMKKAVIASNLPHLRELVIHQKTGFLINPHDTTAWVNALEELLKSDSLRISLGNSAYEFCQRRFTLDMQIKKLQDIYNSVLM